MTSAVLRQIASASFPNVFNPYADRCAVFDSQDAPSRRWAMLDLIIQQGLSSGVDAFWIGRDLGYRGGRRTGFALTDDIFAPSYAHRWNVPFARVTCGVPVRERTATMIWAILDNIPAKVFLWNVFPFHPYNVGDPFSNRAHTRNECKVGEEILSELIGLLRPKQLFAIGADAAASSAKVAGRVELVQVRHPSYGGHKEFALSMRSAYGLP